MPMPHIEVRPRLVRPAREEVAAEDFTRPPAFADDALALRLPSLVDLPPSGSLREGGACCAHLGRNRFTGLYADDLRYTAAWGRWSVWNCTRWKWDETYYVMDLARRVCREASAECQDNIAPRVEDKLRRAAEAIRKWPTARTTLDWKHWVSDRESDITPKFLTRAVNQGFLKPPVRKLRTEKSK